MTLLPRGVKVHLAFDRGDRFDNDCVPITFHWISFDTLRPIPPREPPQIRFLAAVNHHAAAVRNNDVAEHPGQTWSWRMAAEIPR